MSTRTIILRLVAGGYLFYLGLQLIKGYLQGLEGGNQIISIIGGPIFLILGAVFVVTGIMGIAKGYKDFSAEPTEDVDAEEVEENEDTEVVAEVEAEEVVAEEAAAEEPAEEE